jgi:peptidoglycan hydrolase-like protein with peptidoglycan-binding domain
MALRVLPLLFAAAAAASASTMPLPFTREVSYSGQVVSGKDVLILQTLLNRSPSTEAEPIEADGAFGQASADAVATFQAASTLDVTGVFDNATGAKNYNVTDDDVDDDDGDD